VLYHVLVDSADPLDASVPVSPALDVITSDATLAAAEIWLAARTRISGAHPDKRLNLIAGVRHYDYVNHRLRAVAQSASTRTRCRTPTK